MSEEESTNVLNPQPQAVLPDTIPLPLSQEELEQLAILTKELPDLFRAILNKGTVVLNAIFEENSIKEKKPHILGFIGSCEIIRYLRIPQSYKTVSGQSTAFEEINGDHFSRVRQPQMCYMKNLTVGRTV